MSMFGGPEEHAANHPNTWVVRKLYERAWSLQTKDGVRIETRETRRQAEADRVHGRWVSLYDRDTRWYAGDTPSGLKSYAECKAERERNAARWLRP